MGDIYDGSVAADLLTGMRLARAAIGRGGLVVIPTDTVYGIAADAFNAEAVRALVAAKGRTPASPPPVLIGHLPALDALAEDVADEVRALAAKFWPGPLTIIVPARSSLDWDLGETGGTVALRIPDDPIALEFLKDTGPLAVSSANRTGEPPATTAARGERDARLVRRGRHRRGTARHRREHDRRRDGAPGREGCASSGPARSRRTTSGRSSARSGSTDAHPVLRPSSSSSPPG